MNTNDFIFEKLCTECITNVAIGAILKERADVLELCTPCLRLREEPDIQELFVKCKTFNSLALLARILTDMVFGRNDDGSVHVYYGDECRVWKRFQIDIEIYTYIEEIKNEN